MTTRVDRSSTDRPWQFSLRGVFLALTVAAIFIAALRPLSSDTVVMAQRMMAASILATAVLGVAAWRRMRERVSDSDMSNTEAGWEKFAFYCGGMSVLSYGSIWLMILIDPLESRFLAASIAMNFLASVVAIFYPLILLTLVLSLILFWGWRKNPPLLAMRLVSLFASAWLLLAVLLAIAGSV